MAEEFISETGEATGVASGDAGWPDPHRSRHPEEPADQVVSPRHEVSATPPYADIARMTAGGFRVHRPERAWPHPPQAAPIELIAPPAPPEGGASRMASLLPMLGSLAMVGLAFVLHSLVSLVVIGGMVLAMVGGGLATTISQRRSRTKRWAHTTQRYAAHLADVRARAAAAAVAQRDALQACFPDPA
ncbi:MAG TPA: hypothetical protein VF506_07195, partial [Streptosporangiaceae bacterium]